MYKKEASKLFERLFFNSVGRNLFCFLLCNRCFNLCCSRLSCSRFGCCCFLLASSTSGLCFLCSGVFQHCFVVVHQLHHYHFCSVAQTSAKFQYSCVAAVTICH